VKRRTLLGEEEVGEAVNEFIPSPDGKKVAFFIKTPRHEGSSGKFIFVVNDSGAI
jgi:hypothetical protein